MHTRSIARTNRFGRRRTVDGETPWGQNYAVAAIKENITVNGAQKEVARAVVYETGASLLSRLKRAGYEDTAEAKLGLKRTVAMKAVSTQKLLAGFVPAGSFTSTGSMSSFTKDLTPWLVTAPTEAIAVVLIGFPDLEPANTTGGGGPLGPGYICKVAAAGINLMNSQWQDGNCADFGAGYTRVRQMTHCEVAGTMVTLPTYGIALTTGRVSTVSPVSISSDDYNACVNYAGADACNAARTAAETDQNTTYTGIVTMNNIEAANYDCGARHYHWAGPPSMSHGLFGPWGAVYNLPYRDALCCAVAP